MKFEPKAWLARQAYSLVLRAAVPAYLWRIWSRGRQEPGYREDWPARLGFYGAAYRRAWSKGQGASGLPSPLASASAPAATSGPASAPVLWLHAVSLGETRAAVPLIKALREARPGMRLLLTHGTATGREAGKALLQPGDAQTWFPYDTPGAVRRFLRQHRPDVGVLMETEVWPNVQHVAHEMGVPMVLANARLSDKSLRQGLRLAALMRPAAERLRVALAQTEDDARRLRLMGAPDVRVCGNVKFDVTPAPAQLDQGRAWASASGRPIVLAASSREGEEAPLLDAWKAVQSDPAWQALSPRPRLCIVPRHPQRFDEVAAMIKAAGWALSRKSQWPDGRPDAQALAADVWLGDSMGEMPAYYAAARVAFLGGSFAPLGGQNLIEAAACGCPLIMGGSTFNFADAAEMSEAAGAAIRVTNYGEGLAKVVSLCNAEIHARHVKSALLFARSHRGAAQGMTSVIWGCPSP